MRDKLMDVFGIALIVLGVTFSTLILFAMIFAGGRDSAATEACRALDGVAVEAYPSGIVCLDKSAIKTP